MKNLSKLQVYALTIFVSTSLTSISALATDISKANSNTPLAFTNYLGNNENIHPKVLYFENGWNGYEYWMAYTPYPLGDVNAENPCIAVSRNGLDWFSPEGLVNPLAVGPENGYNSDTHLVYDEENDRLECWWRPYDIPSTSDAVYRRVSNDGINWDAPEEMIPFGETGKMRLSPVVWKKGSTYSLLYSDGKKLYETHLDISEPGLNWSEPYLIPIDWQDLRPWHQDAIFDSEGCIELVINIREPGQSNNETDLYYVKLNPDYSQNSPLTKILAKGQNPTDIDSRSIYRSSLVKIGDMYRLYYSCIDAGWHRYMALSEGPSPFDLIGYSMETPSGIGFVNDIALSEEISVYSMEGCLVAKGKMQELSHSIPRGMYIVRGNNSIKKIIR